MRHLRGGIQSGWSPSSSVDYVISSSWDCSVKIWDPTPGASQTPLFELKQNHKVYTMAVSKDLFLFVFAFTSRKLFLALDERQIVVYDLKDLSKPLLNRECLLKYNTRSLCPLLDGSGFIVGSIEGRVGVEYLTESETNKPFSFRCHRTKDNFGTEMIYPVNAIAMHPVFGTFATGGADGSVCVWDAAAKKRLAYFPKWVCDGWLSVVTFLELHVSLSTMTERSLPSPAATRSSRELR